MIVHAQVGCPTTFIQNRSLRSNEQASVDSSTMKNITEGVDPGLNLASVC